MITAVLALHTLRQRRATHQDLMSLPSRDLTTITNDYAS